MRRMPPNEDEQPEDMTNTNKARRQHTVTEQETQYNDEHPEIPKVKRASLHLDDAPASLRLPGPTKRSRAEPSPNDEWEQTPSTTKRPRRPRTEQSLDDQREQAPRAEPSPNDEWEQTPLSNIRQPRRPRIEQFLDDEEQAPSTTRRPRRPRAEQFPDDEWEQTPLSNIRQPRRPRIEQSLDDEEQTPLSNIRQPRRPRTERSLDEEQTPDTIKRPRRPRTERSLDDEWEQTPSPTRQTKRPRAERLPDDEWEQAPSTTRQPRRSRTGQSPDDEWEQTTYLAEQAQQARAQRIQEDEFDQETQTNRPMPSHSGKIIVTQRHRPITYEPHPPDYHRPLKTSLRRQRRSQRALWDHIQEVSQNRAVLFAGSILIALLIIVPLLANFSSGSLVTTIQNMGNDTHNASGINSQHANMPGIAPDTDHPAPPVYATAAFLLDADSGAMLYEHNGSLRLPMMSTTKLMTGLLASQYGGNLDRKIIINDLIANDINQLSADSSVMGAKRGETYTLRELLYGLMLPSGNDAALIIADTVSGSVQKFVGLMNQRAQELALHDTHYENPHGLLADGHYSSAHDLAVLDKVVMDVPVLRQITGTKEYHIPATNEHAEHYFTNGNQFMWWYPGVDGGKIGWDGGANFVQVVSVTRNKHHLIGVAMHTINWWTDMRDMMNWGFNTFTWLSPREINASGLSIPYAADWNYFARDQRDYSIPLNNQGRYYVFTGYTVTQPIVGFFDKNGGLTILGFPISQPQTTNNTLLQQRFEHGTIQCDQGSKQCTKA